MLGVIQLDKHFLIVLVVNETIRKVIAVRHSSKAASKMIERLMQHKGGLDES